LAFIALSMMHLPSLPSEIIYRRRGSAVCLMFVCESQLGAERRFSALTLSASLAEVCWLPTDQPFCGSLPARRFVTKRFEV
jgi:hypothetical protein